MLLEAGKLFLDCGDVGCLGFLFGSSGNIRNLDAEFLVILKPREQKLPILFGGADFIFDIF